MNFDSLMPFLMLGTSFVAMGVGLITLSSVATLRGFIAAEIAAGLGELRRKVDDQDERITANHAALTRHIESHQ